MLFDLSNDLHIVQFQSRCASLLKRGVIVELTEKKARRSNPQNAYLHVILSFFALERGYTMEYVKKYYFKILVNPDIFVVQKSDEFLGQFKDLRSSSDLSSEDMTVAIERFRNWSANEADIYLPAPHEQSLLQQMEIEISRNKQWL